MVADAVCDEPVSGQFSLVTGKITGNLGKITPDPAVVSRCSREISEGWTKILDFDRDNDVDELDWKEFKTRVGKD